MPASEVAISRMRQQVRKFFFEDSEGYIREVVLEKENGKWYVERVN